jgi:hypothetical protein
MNNANNKNKLHKLIFRKFGYINLILSVRILTYLIESCTGFGSVSNIKYI